jgi:hypothetical protein
MPKTSGRILKSDEVKLEGQFRLDVAQAQSSTGGPKQKKPPLAAPQVRIVENHHEFALIETTCSCGTKTLVKCEYADTQAPQEPKIQNGRTNVTDQTTKNNKVNGENQNAG